MKPIVIKESNRDRIQSALDQAQERARVRTVSADDVIRSVERIQEILKVSTRKLNGSTAWIDPHAQTFPGAYKGIPESTQFQISATAGTWKLIKIIRGRCKGATQGINISLSEEGDEAILSHINGSHPF